MAGGRYGGACRKRLAHLYATKGSAPSSPLDMHRTITISLPVADLADSTAFYTALGFTQDLRFSDPEAAFMGWSEVIHITLLTHTRWHTLTDRPILPSMSSEVGLNISVESRTNVHAINAAAGWHCSIADFNPIQDNGLMYGRDFADPDRHIWGAVSIMHRRPRPPETDPPN
jgi:predicted lactoylglutathione lyase